MRSPSSFGLFSACLLVGAAVGTACSDRPDRSDTKGLEKPADVVAGRIKTFDHFESTDEKFTIEFPETWRGAYTAVPRNDTTGGARRAIEFAFKPDASWKVEPHTLIVVRIFTKAAWDRLDARRGQTVAAKVAARGDDVFALSLPAKNPYKTGTPAAVRFDQLMLSILQDSAGLRLTAR
jgi:hypothetical protein